jgi:ABC-type ATPase involved in cell division
MFILTREKYRRKRSDSEKQLTPNIHISVLVRNSNTREIQSCVRQLLEGVIIKSRLVCCPKLKTGGDYKQTWKRTVKENETIPLQIHNTVDIQSCDPQIGGALLLHQVGGKTN